MDRNAAARTKISQAHPFPEDKRTRKGGPFPVSLKRLGKTPIELSLLFLREEISKEYEDGIREAEYTPVTAYKSATAGAPCYNQRTSGTGQRR